VCHSCTGLLELLTRHSNVNGGSLDRVITALDALTELLGRLVSWGLLLMMLTTCLVVVLRYVFNSGNLIFYQEVISYLHATTFLLAMGWALKHEGHVRVDIFYRRMGLRQKAWVNTFGTLFFLLPFTVFLLIISVQFVERAWITREASPDAGGIPYVYLLKTLIPAMCVLLMTQGIAELLRNAVLLCSSSSVDLKNKSGEKNPHG